MRCATRRLPRILVAAGLLAAPASGAAAPAKTVLATCDQVPGYTEAASEHWRAFRLRLLRDGEQIPIYLCRRGSAPVRRLIRVTLG